MSNLANACLSALALMVVPSMASAQYYTPPSSMIVQSHQPGGAGLDLGLRDGVYPSVGAGVGQVGFGLGAGAGARGVGAGTAIAVGPLGGTTDLGLSPNGFGTQGSAGWGSQTGAAYNAGISRDGVGLGGRAEVLGVGTGGSFGVGRQGPDLGASVAFGSLGTLQLGSHAFQDRGPRTYPGAAAGFDGLQPNQTVIYYQPRIYGNAPYYPPAQVCPSGWTCQ